MKKILYVLIMVPLLLVVCGCVNKTYDEITYDELSDMIDNKESFVLFLGSATCTHCDAFKVTIKKVVEDYGVDIKYIDISKLEDSQLGSLQAKFPFSGTPATIFITKGEEENTFNRIEGDKSYSKVVDILKENGYIKE